MPIFADMSLVKCPFQCFNLFQTVFEACAVHWMHFKMLACIYHFRYNERYVLAEQLRGNEGTKNQNH